MRIFIDECVWLVTRDFVRQFNIDIATVKERGLAGADDRLVLAQAISENRVFLTRDMHFSNILLYPPQNYLGIIVLRIAPHTITSVHHTLSWALTAFTQDSIQKTLVIVDHNKYRTRR